jgi:ectoine hydroxylase
VSDTGQDRTPTAGPGGAGPQLHRKGANGRIPSSLLDVTVGQSNTRSIGSTRAEHGSFTGTSMLQSAATVTVTVTAADSEPEPDNECKDVMPLDKYPSRNCPLPHIIPRTDPVVWSPFPTGDTDSNDDAPLTSEQHKHFEENGFLLLESVFSGQEINQLCKDVVALKQRYEAKMKKSAAAVTVVNQDSHAVAEPSTNIVKSVFEAHLKVPSIMKAYTDPRTLNVARYLLNDDVYIHQNRVNYQPSFVGQGFAWHSDIETWHVEDGMPQMRAVSCLIMLTDNLSCNGPLFVVPGSHHWFISCIGETPDNNWERSLGKQEIGVPHQDMITSLANQNGIVSCVAPAGSVLFFDCNLLHASSNNITPWPRINCFNVYNAVSNKLVDPFGGTQPRPGHIANREFTPLQEQ